MANKMMKKTLAMVLAVSLCVSQLALPAIAVEGQITDEIVNPVVSSSVNTDPTTGATTSTETITGTTADGTAVKQTTTNTQNTQEGATPMDVTHTENWEQTTEATKPNGDTETTKVTGEETVETGVNQLPNGDQEYYVDGEGKETTTTTGSETQQVSQNETVLDSEFETGGDTTSNDTKLPTDPNVNDQGQWQQKGDLNIGQWEKVGETEGKEEWTEVKALTPEEGNVVIADPKLSADAGDDVSITGLTPGGDQKETVVNVTLDNVAKSLYPQLFQQRDGETMTQSADGSVYTFTSADGKTVRVLKAVEGGFELTETTTENPGAESTADASKYTNTPMESGTPSYSKESKTSVEIPDFEDKLNDADSLTTDENGIRTGVKTTTGTADITTPSGVANGVKTETTSTVEDVTDASGNKGYREIKIVKYDNVVTTETLPLTDATNAIPTYADQVTTDHRYDKPEQANDVLALAVTNRDNGDGTFTTITVKEVLESHGSSSISDVAGYEVVETKTDKDGKVISTETKTHNNVVPPMVLDRDNGDGTFTNVTLTEIKADKDTDFYKAGDVIGWTARTVLTDEDGNVLETKERDVFGTEVTLTTTVTTNAEDMTKTTTYERTDTYITNAFASHHERTANLQVTQQRTYVINSEEELHRYIQASDKPENLTFIYQGKMLKVEVIKNGGHGTGTEVGANFLTKDTYNYDHDDGIQGKDYEAYKKGNLWHYYSFWDEDADISGLTDEEWTYDGKGLLSIFKMQSGANADQSNGQEGKMFRVVNGKGEEQFVYCVEFDQQVTEGVDYTYDVYGDVYEQNGVIYENDSEMNAYLCSTALNGFWGTASGIGSLSAVQDFMRRMGYADADKLTAGEAVTATQAAIWHFSAENADDDFVSGKFVTYINNLDGNAIEDANTIKNDERVKRIYNLFDALVDAATDDQADGYVGAAQAINEGNITAGQIDVKQSMGNNQYKTDLHVKLNVSKSSINDNMVMKVTETDENGNTVVLGTFRLSGKAAEGETYVTMDDSGNIILPDVILTNNKDVKVELTGQQTLDQGVRVYVNSSAQDFMGLSTKIHNVALQFGYWLNLIDPEFEYSNGAREMSQTNTVTYRADANYKEVKDTKTVTHEGYMTDRNTYVSQLNGVVTNTLKIDKNTLENVRWDFYYDYVLTVVDDEDGGGNGDEVILDEEVPLAAAPKTGDPSMVMAAMSALSMAGYSVLGLKRKNDEE